MDYLLDLQPGPLTPENFAVHLALLGLLGLSLVGSLKSRPPLILATLFSTLALVLIFARFLQIPVLSMRLLLIATVFGGGGVWVSWGWGVARHRGWLDHLVRLFTFSWDSLPEPLPLSVQASLFILHLAGMAVIAQQLGVSYLQTVAFLFVVYLPLLIEGLARIPRRIYLEALAPFFLVYGVAAARSILGNIFVIPLYDPFAFPNALNAVLSVEAWLIAAAAYALLAETYIILWRHKVQEKFLLVAGVGLSIFALSWASAEYFGHRTRGVTGSDPYIYVQMAVDLVERGTPLHLFPLFPQMNTLGISWWPIVHVGYHLPLDGEGNSASVWPVGDSLLLALGYRLFGEEGLYLTTPFLGILSALALFALALEVLRGWTAGERVWAAAWAAFLLATSYEQIDRLLVPMADALAQLFTTLTLLLALVAIRRNQLFFAALSGLAWGMAYFIRHTQLVMGIPVLLAFLLLLPERKKLLPFSAAFGLAALLVALPDLFYHQVIFGNFLTPESEELMHFSLANIGLTLPSIFQRLLESNEFGYLIPLLVWGGGRLYRDHPRLFWVIGSWILAILVIHLPYRFLRLRDILSLYPALALFVAYGMGNLFRWAMSKKGSLVGATAIILLLVLPALRVRILLPRPLSTYTATFGYMTEDERDSFDVLAGLVPENGVVGTSLNGGPIGLYAQRDAFRPEVWSTREFEIFLRAMEAGGRKIYILDDGASLITSLEYLRKNHRLVEEAQLQVPLFGEGPTGTLYRVELGGLE